MKPVVLHAAFLAAALLGGQIRAGEAYLFDMDGVLADDCPYHVKAWQVFLPRHGGQITEKQVMDWMGCPNSVIISRVFGEGALSPERLRQLSEEKEAVFREIYAPHLRCPEGLRELLEHAKRRGIPCAVVTGAIRANVDFILDGLGIRGYFREIVDSSRYSRGKPAPDCFLMGAKLLGAEPSECTVFEDAVNGIKAGKAAGMRVIGVTTSLSRDEIASLGADRAIDTFLELEADWGMKTEANSRTVAERTFDADLVVCGGGLSGVCAAIAAARHGTKTILIQDRPMLGGNASSEVRMGICGASGDNNKEGGILEELQLMNIHDNPLMRYTLWDDVLLSAVVRENNIQLMLNTSVNDVVMDGGRIAAVRTWNSNAYTRDTVRGRIFMDCTGDGILRLSGAKFRRGRELPEEFGEDFLRKGGDARTMGNSILMQLRKTDAHRPYRAPEWAYRFTDADFERRDSTEGVLKDGFRYTFKRLHPENGKGGYNNFWWIEYGGNIDTIRDANRIQFELKRIAYGVWEYMKNHPDGRCRGYELDWIGALPGKRESTRFVGPHILTQGDIMSGRRFPDVVAYGGWTLDDHHPDAFFNRQYAGIAHEAPSPFQIPLRCLYSVNVPNLMFAGRDISVTHMGLSATRVMGTCAALGQAAGTAAAVALAHGTTPDGVYRAHIAELQAMLEDDDCMLPGRWRKVSALTAEAAAEPASAAVLKNGIDRDYDGRDNGVWLPPGGSVVYRWSSPRRVSGVRLVFDSIMQNQWKYDKRLRKLEATREYERLPPPLAKAFDVEVESEGKWRKVYSDEDNYLRLRKVGFDASEASAVRLTVRSSWGGGKAHVFGFDAL